MKKKRRRTNMEGINHFVPDHCFSELPKVYQQCNPSATDTLPFYYYENYLMGSMRTWLDLGDDESISTCGTFHCGTIFHNEEVEAAATEGETRKLRGIWLHPRFHQVPANQSWVWWYLNKFISFFSDEKWRLLRWNLQALFFIQAPQNFHHSQMPYGFFVPIF